MTLAKARSRSIHALLLVLLLCMPLAAGTSWAAGQPIHGTFEGTGEKPQSKLWYNDGTWRAIIKREGHGLHFYEFDGTGWHPSSFVDAELGAGGAADVKWNGEELFVLSYSSHPQLFKFTYDRPLRVFHLVAGFPVHIPIAPGSETMVLDQDSTGRLWATYEAGAGEIYVCWSTSPDQRTWFAPGIVLRTGVKDDDISTLAAFDRKIGVFWSDQARWQFGFRMHRDEDPPDVWQSVEIVKSGSGCSDDHLNMKADGRGNLYAVTKDLGNHMTFHYRDVRSGRWSNKSGVIPDTGTRGIVMVSDQDKAIYVPFTNWSSSSLYIYLRKASYGTFSFKTVSSPLMSGVTLNNCTGTKQVLPSGCFMVMAEGGGRTWWNGWGELPPDGPPPPAPPLEVAAGLREHGPSNERPPLVLDLPLDEGAGESAADAALGAAAHLAAAAGKTTLPVWTDGHAGSALRFDGQSAYAEVPSSAALRIAGSFTIEARVRWDGSATPGTILSKGRSSRRNYQMIVRNDGKIDFRWEVSGGTRHGLVGTRPLVPGTWQHVACVYDAEAGRSSIWIDGRLDTGIADLGTPVGSDDPVELGRRLTSSSTADYLTGTLDEVRVWRGVRYRAEFDPDAPDPSADVFRATRSVQVSWASPDPAVRLAYCVYRRAGGGLRVQLARDLAATGFVDESPVSGTLCYEVSSVDSLGREGRRSAPACLAYTPESAPPPDLSKAELAIRGFVLRASPNPFNPSTRISLALPGATWARLAVYDVSGRRVALLHEGSLAAGEHSFHWAARGPQVHLHSGVYFARLDVPGRTLHHKLVLVQ